MIIDHVQFAVKNIEDTVDFYRDHFDFEIVDIGLRCNNRWCIIKHPEYEVALCMIEEKDFISARSDGEQIYHFGLVVDDFIGIRNKLKKSVKIEPENSLALYDKSSSFYFYDINGYKIEISEKLCGGL
ncbi:VOC family protein [Vibrio alginolyticus]